MSSHKIMVVDDNTVTRRMVCNALERKGHTVLEAPDGKTARELMIRWKPRVVLQDLTLPDADGFLLVGELRGLAQGSEVSILAFSGFVSQLDEARVSAVGFDDIIAKPIAPSRLVPLIEAHLPVHVPASGKFGAGRRVVVADDDPIQLKHAVFRLTRVGFECESVPDGAAALAAVRRRIPDVLISDVMMPDLDGFGLAMAVRQDPRLRKLPVLLVTSSYVEPADRELARRAGATHLLPRTPELFELLDALSATLEDVPEVAPLELDELHDLEQEHSRRVFRQLERQVLLNTGLAKRCSALASELTVLTRISDAVLKHRDVDAALDEALAECFDAGGIAGGALYLGDSGALRVRAIGCGQSFGTAEELQTFFGHEALLRAAIRDGRTIYLPSSDVPPTVQGELLARTQGTALMIVPLTEAEVPLGGLVMVARGRELDRSDWMAFARGMATQISHVLALARAYADRESAERRATEHAALLDAVFVSAPDHVLHLDLDGSIRFVNRGFGARSAESLIGTNFLDYPSGEHQAALRTAFERLRVTGEPQGFEASALASDGTPQWFSTRLGPVKQNGVLSGAVVVARDVSDKKQTELHLMVADRMASVGTLAAGVAHEINNPLASVIANLDMALQEITSLADHTMLPPDLTDELQDARVAADRVRVIVRDLKIFSRADEEKQGPVDVHHVLDSTIRMAWNELRHRAKLTKSYGTIPLAAANESRLGQVFLNLIINAVHSLPSGNYDANRITISTSVDRQGGVVIGIADTGSGIAPEVRPRLFTPFFSTKPVGLGTGLGLAISHKIVTSFGGTIAYDTVVGQGTEFRVTLPAAAHETSVRGSTRPTGAPASRRGTVLVVDDENSLAQAIKRYLSLDHDVTAVLSAQSALDLMWAGRRYDVVLCDLMMPQITGMQLAAEVTALDPEQADRMVFMTGGAFTPSAREFLDSTTNLHLEKPFDLKELRKLVNDLIR